MSGKLKPVTVHTLCAKAGYPFPTMFLGFLDIGSRKQEREREIFSLERGGQAGERRNRERERVSSQEKTGRTGKIKREARETETHQQSLLQTATIQVGARRTRKRARDSSQWA
jgi:hypothetical protein